MPVSIPSTLFPVFPSALQMGRELVQGTAPTAFTSIPVKAMTTKPKITWIPDQALRGSNVETYQMGQGPLWSELTIPQSPAYGDTLGHPLFSLCGDYTSTGTAASPASTLNGAVAAGATTITVASGTGFAANQWVQVDVGSIAEIVQILSVATNVLTLVSTTPTRFSHLTGVAITNTAANYTHTFSNLNPNSGTGNTGAQPPSYTFLHRNYLAGSGNDNADAYLYGHVTQMKLEAKATDFLLWDAMAVAYQRTYPSSNIVPAFSTVTAWPAWSSTITLAAGAIYNISDMTVTITRTEDTITTLDGSQNPYVFGAGPLKAMFSIDYDAVSNENALNYALNNTQPALVYSVSNGLTSPNTVSLSLTAPLAAHQEAPLAAQTTLWGYKPTGELIASTSAAGNSGGYSPLQIVLVNAIPSY